MTFQDKIDLIISDNKELKQNLNKLKTDNVLLHEQNTLLLKENMQLQMALSEAAEQALTEIELEIIAQGQLVTELELKQLEFEVNSTTAEEVSVDE